MTSNEIREKFLKYFESKGHKVVPSSGLIPEGDPTLLFTNAGMVQFKKVLLGEERRPYSRAASSQKCVRAGGKHNDLENVGHTPRHHTFFEMLGNFSFGDYFKEDAIKYAWEFLTVEMTLPKEKLFATVFETDDEAEELWKTVTDISHDRIYRLGEADNFWSMGEVGPCGPCSEILIDQGEELGCKSPDCKVGCECDRYLELWNLVFMQYDRDGEGLLTPLPKPSIDTGLGLERLSAVMQGKLTNYETDLFKPIIELVEKLSKKTYGKNDETDISIRAVADHARSAAFLISDGLLPSNEGRGYVLRRIIRRAARHGRFIGFKEPFLYKVAALVADFMGDIYPELKQAEELILKATESEETRFFETLDKGLSILTEEITAVKKAGKDAISGAFAFKLYDTYGFPIDLTADIVKKDGLKVDEDEFILEMERQKETARKSWKGSSSEDNESNAYLTLSEKGLKSKFVGYDMAVTSSDVTCILKDGKTTGKALQGDHVAITTAETPFYGESGGQTGDTGTMVGTGVIVRVLDTKRTPTGLTIHQCVIEEGSVEITEPLELVPDIDRRRAIRRNHTATHLLHAALRKKLGNHVRQAGSLVTDKALRFDFNHFSPLGTAEIEEIERDVNAIIAKDIIVTTEELSYKEAVAKGALAFFGEKYGTAVRMVAIEGASIELCGGTHVSSTGDIGLIKVSSESSVAAGVRRIEALSGEGAINLLTESDALIRKAALILKSSRLEVPDKVSKLLERQKALEKELTKLKAGDKSKAAVKLIDKKKTIDGVSYIASSVTVEDPKELRHMADALRQKLGSGIVVLTAKNGEKAIVLAAVTKDLTKRFSAGDIVREVAPIIGGKGGGRPDMAQGGGELPDKVKEAAMFSLKTIEEMIKKSK